jgi:hypothetical protein
MRHYEYEYKTGIPLAWAEVTISALVCDWIAIRSVYYNRVKARRRARGCCDVADLLHGLSGLFRLVITVFRDTKIKDLKIARHYTSNLSDRNPSLDHSTSSWWDRHRQVDWVCDEETVERRLFYKYAVRELPNRVNEIHKWGSSQYGLTREGNALWSLNFDGMQISDVYELL